MQDGYIDIRINDRYEDSVESPSSLFKLLKQPSWFEDEFVKDLLKGVDGTTVLFEEALKDRHGRGISTECISGGCKSVILMKYAPDNLYSTEFFGDNCWEYIIKLAKHEGIVKLYPMSDNVVLDDYYDDYYLFRLDGKPVSNIYDVLEATAHLWDSMVVKERYVL